jgi:hypothetical protein
VLTRLCRDSSLTSKLKAVFPQIGRGIGQVGRGLVAFILVGLAVAITLGRPPRLAARLWPAPTAAAGARRLGDVERVLDVDSSPHRGRVDHDQAGEGLLRTTEARDVIARLLGRHAGHWHQAHSSRVRMTAPAAPNRSIKFDGLRMPAIELIVKPGVTEGGGGDGVCLENHRRRQGAGRIWPQAESNRPLRGAFGPHLLGKIFPQITGSNHCGFSRKPWVR